jgi:hypothetical protein
VFVLLASPSRNALLSCIVAIMGVTLKAINDALAALGEDVRLAKVMATFTSAPVRQPNGSTRRCIRQPWAASHWTSGSKSSTG